MASGNEKKFVSNAEWPEGVVFSKNNLTKDYHWTKKEAEDVCELLKSDGFGGDGIVFPTNTFITEIK